MTTLVLIPARGGSKGVPGKNIKILGGKPLIQHTIDAARELFADDQILVSTDDPKIKAVVEATGLTVPFLRPAELATDTAGSHEVMLHALDYYENSQGPVDRLVLLQPTSPFRTANHIKEALALYDNTMDMVVAVKETQANPYYVLREEDDQGWLQPSKPVVATRRQDVPTVYEINGAIYIIKVAALRQAKLSDFKKVKKYVMDERSSHDIDTPLDWAFAEVLLSL
jgi:N-acylneuraminate cytidylyltransferase